MNLLEVFGPHLGEIKIRHNKVHTQNWIVSSAVLMALQHRAQCTEIFRRLQTVKIVGPFAERQSSRSKLLQSLLIAQTASPPIVALQNYQRTIKVKSSNRQQI